ncbi:unnamed protein product [Albugo candida]|nr:unnamed protein product [Albugo candida]|eukprot:CCI50343.1 unnamed protein product [Albugo candida]
MYDEQEEDTDRFNVDSIDPTSIIMASTRITSTVPKNDTSETHGPIPALSDIAYRQRCSKLASAIDSFGHNHSQNMPLELKFGQNAPFVFDNKIDEDSYTAMTPETVDIGKIKMKVCVTPQPPSERLARQKARKEEHLMSPQPDPFYGDQLDESDQKWVDQHLRSHSPIHKKCSDSNSTNDAHLSCPCCFLTVCMDSERHVRYQHQYRALHAINCRVCRNKIITHTTMDRKCSEKSSDIGDRRCILENDDDFFLVQCSDCGTTVGVYDRNDVYHFFNLADNFMADVAQFQQLKAALEEENFSKCIEICNKIRAKDSNDADAVKIKCISLIRLENFDKALELAKKYDFLSTEKLYCLYRLKKVKELRNSLIVLKSVGQDAATVTELENYKCPLYEKPKAILHIEAQMLYRAGEYVKCIEIYEYLREHAMTHEDILEIETNLLAAHASGNYCVPYSCQSKFEDLDKGNYEVAYNKAFGFIHAQDWNRAEAILADAKKLYRETLDEQDPIASELDDEMAQLHTQLAFVRQMKGDSDEAVKNYRDVLKARNPVPSAIATNNLVVIRKDRDLLDSLKKLKSLEGSGILTKMSFQQQRAVHYNKALVLCLLNKPEECLKCIQELIERSPDSNDFSGILVSLANNESSSHASKATHILENDKSVDGRLGLACLQILRGNLEEAGQCIMSIDSIQHTPGTVATLVSIFEAANKPELAEKVLTSALQHQDKIGGSDFAVKMREGMCMYKLKMKKYEDAADAFKKLLENEDGYPIDAASRLRFLASFVICLSYIDPEKAKIQCAMLPGIAEMSNKDPVELERLAPQSTRKTPKPVILNDKKDLKRHKKSTEQIARKRAKKREAYLEKLRSQDDYNPSIGLLNPDPERWISRKQRSSSKRSRRGRNRFVGAQGAGMATEKDALRLDAAARAATKQQNETADKRAGPVAKNSSSALFKKAKKKRR